MIDVDILRTDPDRVVASQRARGADEGAVERARAADTARREAISAYNDLRAEQKRVSKQIARAPRAQKAELVSQASELSGRVKAAEATSREADEAFTTAMRAIPNLIGEGVPSGGEDDFEVRELVGSPQTFDFEPRDHVALGEGLGMFDMERGAKVSGARFYYLTGWGMRLQLALLTMGLDQAVANGFTPMITPTIVNPSVMQGTGFLDSHADEIYHLDADDQYLTGTSEVALAGYHSDEIIDLASGPKRYAGWSTCYRRESGSGGKDTRGILRVHQFDKLEMFVYTRPEDAVAEHERLLAWQQEMLNKCELSYRVIVTAAGDLGSSAAKKYDCEAWVPTQDRYRELTSTSNCSTFQARRLNIRYRDDDGATQAAATLNGTLATTRWIVALLEQHQQADGSVRVPQALQRYLGTDVIAPEQS